MPRPRPPGPLTQARAELAALEALLGRLEVAARRSVEPPLSETQQTLLFALHQLGGQAKHRDLAGRLVMDGAWASRNLQALVARGWVRRCDPDKRTSRLELTEAGAAVVAAHQLERERLWRQVWARLPPGQRGRVAAAIRALNRAIERTFEANLARTLAEAGRKGRVPAGS